MSEAVVDKKDMTGCGCGCSKAPDVPEVEVPAAMLSFFARQYKDHPISTYTVLSVALFYVCVLAYSLLPLRIRSSPAFHKLFVAVWGISCVAITGDMAKLVIYVSEQKYSWTSTIALQCGAILFCCAMIVASFRSLKNMLAASVQEISPVETTGREHAKVE